MNDDPTTSYGLNPVELATLKDRNFLPTKQRVCHKIEAWLGELGQALMPLVAQAPSSLPEALRTSQPKLSRGENYHSYAYRVLDYPRLFDGADMLTFRTLVLWGHPIGFHLMLAGRYRDRYLPRLIEQVPQLPEGYFLSAQDQPWIWEAQAEGLLPAHHITSETAAQVLQERAFAKVSYFLDLEDYKQLVPAGCGAWQRWAQALS